MRVRVMRRVMLIDVVEALARRELRWIRGLWVVGDLLDLLDLLSLGWRRQWMGWRLAPIVARIHKLGLVGLGRIGLGREKGIGSGLDPGLGKLWLLVGSCPVESLCCAVLGDGQRVN